MSFFSALQYRQNYKEKKIDTFNYLKKSLCPPKLKLEKPEENWLEYSSICRIQTDV